MKLSAKALTASLAFLLSGGGLAWRASTADAGIGKAVGAFASRAKTGVEVEAVLRVPEPEPRAVMEIAAVAATVTPAPVPPRDGHTLLPIIGGDCPPPLPGRFGRPPSLAARAWPEFGVAAVAACGGTADPGEFGDYGESADFAEPGEWKPEDAGDAAIREESLPGLLTEEQARLQVMEMFGGEAAQFSRESDLAYAYAAAKRALRERGIALADVETLAVIDFTLPSFERRLALYNPRTGEESRHLVAHGHHSGTLNVESFSNVPGSLQSSPGLYRVGRHYHGEHGPAIRLHGLDPGINDQAYARDVVMHAAWYVSYRTILENQLELGVPRIGRSHGCPAVSPEDMPIVEGKLQPGSYLFIYPAPRRMPDFSIDDQQVEGSLR